MPILSPAALIQRKTARNNMQTQRAALGGENVTFYYRTKSVPARQHVASPSLSGRTINGGEAAF